MQNLLEITLRAQLYKIANNVVDLDTSTVDTFTNSCTNLIKTRFNETRSNKFTPRMSNIGRPLCQLLAQKYNLPKYPSEYNSISRFIIGDLIEHFTILLINSASIPIQSQDTRVSLKVGAHTIYGTYDIELNDKIWDIKSASEWSFKNKFGESGGFAKLVDDDAFGYVTQLVLYSEASGKDMGGWIVVNKTTGEINVVEVPTDTTALRAKVLKEVKNKLDILESDTPFYKTFDVENETYYKDNTGNTTLSFICGYCDHKKHCWPDAVLAPSVVSKAKTPNYKWYNFIHSDYKKDKNGETV